MFHSFVYVYQRVTDVNWVNLLALVVGGLDIPFVQIGYGMAWFIIGFTWYNYAVLECFKC